MARQTQATGRRIHPTVQPPIRENLLREIERTGVTNRELAHALGVSERQITRWKSDHMPSFTSVVVIARYFGRRPEWFYAMHPPEDKAA
jgi:transcriptional regulator with XRE-family HTH domain